MPMRRLNLHSSPHLSGVSSALTSLATSLDLGADRDIVVHAFDAQDTPNWEKLPTIWHLFGGSVICVNMTKVYNTIYASFPKDEIMGRPVRRSAPRSELVWKAVRGQDMLVANEPMLNELPEYIRTHASVSREDGYRYETFDRFGKFNTQTVDKTHVALYGRIETHYSYTAYTGGVTNMLYNLLVGAVMRESAYSVFEQPMLDSAWFRETTGYQKNILAVFEELRIEKQQMLRINGNINGAARRLMRSAIPITANTRAVIADMTRRISTPDGDGLGAAQLGLNSTLILGRVHTTTLLQFEVASIRNSLSDYLTVAQFNGMDEIWSEYVDITTANDADMLPLVEKWQELFPSRKDGSNAASSVAPGAGSGGAGSPGGDPSSDPSAGAGESGDPSDSSGESADGSGDGEGEGEGNPENGDGQEGGGFNDEFNDDEAKESESDTPIDANARGSYGGVTDTYGNKYDGPSDDPDRDDPRHRDDVIPVQSEGAAEELEQAAEPVQEAVHHADYKNQEWGPNDLTPSRVSYEQAKHRKPMNSAEAIERGREIKPTTTDHALAVQFSKVLENLNVTDRGKFTRAQTLPPGRMKSRAAVQQAAERAMKLPATAKPWARTMHTVDLNPPLTLGIMTDVSGSQGWAEQISAELAWIFSRATSKIGGRVAALTFGMGVTITQRPGEVMTNAQVVAADDGGELFDMGAGTMDTMLNLKNGTGTRMLFVLTDGRFGVSNEMEKCAKWVKELTKAGVYVVWVTPDPSAADPEELRRRFTAGHASYTPEGVIPICAHDLQMAMRGRGSKDEQGEKVKLIQAVEREVTRAVTIGKASARR